MTLIGMYKVEAEMNNRRCDKKTFDDIKSLQVDIGGY